MGLFESKGCSLCITTRYKDIYPQKLTVNIMTNERIDLFN